MTPLAQLVIRQNFLRQKDRCAGDLCAMHLKMADVHSFDVSNVMSLVYELETKLVEDHTAADDFLFLPAPKTWIEFEHNSQRHAFLMIESADKKSCSVFGARSNRPAEDYLAQDLLLEMRLGHSEGPAFKYRTSIYSEETYRRWAVIISAALILINSPRVIGRRQHMPHRGLEKKLLGQRKIIGSFPLHAWTEIQLKVTPPKDVSGEPSTEGHLTGERALHFVRKHVRIRLGRLEYVESHWRGDPALGIKRSRYRLAA